MRNFVNKLAELKQELTACEKREWLLCAASLIKNQRISYASEHCSD